jgi:hypothetical protein
VMSLSKSGLVAQVRTCCCLSATYQFGAPPAVTGRFT